MIVNNDNTAPVASSGIVSEKSFSIKLDGKAFKMLSDQLYTNKIGSIVRELSCNALDSHKAAGKAATPFDIHLPSAFEPTFWVRDYGLGMSPEMVENIYTTYFESTKDQANDSIGGFGLGGKTPFSYGSSFNITTVYNGKKHFYSAMLGDNGVPTVSLFDSIDSTEVNGVTIEMNVNEDDYRRFANEVIEQLRFFKVKPNLLNNANGYEWEKIKYNEKFGSRFMVTENLRGMWAVQGEVGYPIDYREFADKITDKSKLELFNLYRGGVMFFDIGQIEVTVSREAVSYSQHTIKNLEDFVGDVAPMIYKGIKEKIEAFKNDYERLVYLNSDDTARRFAKFAGLRFGKDGNTGDKLLDIHANSGSGKYTINLTKHVSQYGLRISAITRNDKGRAYFKPSSEIMFQPEANTMVVARNPGRATISGLRNEAERTARTIWLVESPNGTKAVDDAFVGVLSAALGGMEIKLSSLYASDDTYGTARKNATPVVYMHPEGTNYLISSLSRWTKIYDEEELESGYFLEFSSYPHIKLDDSKFGLISKVFEAKLFDKPIYVIKDQKSALLKDNPNFSNAYDKAVELYEAYKKKMMSSDTVVNRYKLATVANMHMRGLKNIANSVCFWNSHKEMAEVNPSFAVMARAERVTKIAERYIARIDKRINKHGKIARELMAAAASSIDDAEVRKSVVKVASAKDIQKLVERYPMVRHLPAQDWYYRDRGGKAIIKEALDYVKMVEASKKVATVDNATVTTVE